MDVVIATRNTHKVRELAALLGVPGVRWTSLREFPHLPPVKEDGRSFAVNAIKKARAVAKATGGLALADDSGLEVDALGGAPGVRSARFAGAHGDDAANNRKLLKLLDRVMPSKRRARYRCVLALASPTRLLALTHGTWSGRIAHEPKGRGGFGYDPVFLVPRLNHTVGELPLRVKQRLSHRAKAAAKMRTFLKKFSARRRAGSGAGRPGRGRPA